MDDLVIGSPFASIKNRTQNGMVTALVSSKSLGKKIRNNFFCVDYILSKLNIMIDLKVLQMKFNKFIGVWNGYNVFILHISPDILKPLVYFY